MLRLRTVGALLGLCGAFALTSCSTTGHTDPGAAAALPDQKFIATSQTAEFDKLFAKFDSALTDGHSVRGTMFKHASFGKRSLDAEWDVELVGKGPASVFVRSRVSNKFAGDNLDTLHIAGSKYDYNLLSGRYKSIAPTPWCPDAHHLR